MFDVLSNACSRSKIVPSNSRIFLPMLWKGSGSLRTATFTQRSWQRVVFKIAVFVCCIAGFTVFSHSFAFAQTNEAVQNVATVATQAGVNASGDLYVLIGRVIYALLSVLGLVLLGYLLYAGFLWTTAGENVENVERARRMIQNAIIGLFIIAASFAITAFVLSRLSDISSSAGEGDSAGGPRVSFPSAAGALGNGIIEYHLPMRDAVGVPRNTSIIVTFKESIKISSLIQGYDDAGTPADLTDDHTATALNVGTIHIVKIEGAREETLASDQVDVHFTEDRKTFVFKPKAWLGSSTVNMPYRVEIMPGRTGLLREDGQPAFGPDFPSGYRWRFEVSTVVDLTPPQITSIVPARGVQPPNVVIQINFNEAIDPTSASGIFRAGRGFSNIEVSSGSSDPLAPTTRVEGEWKISNRYQTVEFVTDDICGRNACGRDIRCLPRSASIALIARAASLSAEPPQARIVSTGGGGALYDGIVDVASNSLDGNANGTAQGPGADDAHSAFGTSADVALTAPRISSTTPVFGVADYPVGSSNLPPEHEPTASFGPRPLEIAPVNMLQASTVNSANVYMTLQNEPAESARDTFWFTPYETLLTAVGAPATGEDAAFGRLALTHRLYARLPRTAAPGTLPPVYAPIITSGVQNLLQNCFKPSASATCPATVGSGTVPGNPNCCDDRPGSTACSFSHRTP